MPVLIILVMSLAAYASVAVAARRKLATHSSVVEPLELIVMSVALTLILAFRRSHSIAYMMVCAALMGALGAIMATAMRERRERGIGGTREFAEPHSDAIPANAWKKWLRFSRSVVDFEIRFALAACYFVLIGPMSLVFRPMAQEKAKGRTASTWISRSAEVRQDQARRPF